MVSFDSSIAWWRAGPQGRHSPGPVHRLSKSSPGELQRCGRKVYLVFVGGVKKGRITPFLGESYSHVAKGMDFL